MPVELGHQPANWLAIHQPFAFHALDRFHHPRPVLHLPKIPPEAEFGTVAVQVLLAEPVEGSVVPALQ